ncbi:MAG TPA: YbhB/YbcL family Raf kinase inhibitor-like protein [Candidatus Goldiibacteriota bacterium]|nr:YbhB/YbcL family Raf kinase inhibitor-like protein [Candidatus Goldiibacteriota bacterium]
MKKTILVFPALFVLCFVFSAAQTKPEKLTVTSPAFKHGKMIPGKYTCKGENVSPEINWTGAPKGTKSFVLICDDPDAPSGTWVHWVVYNIPADVTKLDENFPKIPALKNGIKQAKTSFGSHGYGGPCPPSGTHRYYFKIYAINKLLTLDPKKSTKKEVLKAMEGSITGYGELMGMFGK